MFADKQSLNFLCKQFFVFTKTNQPGQKTSQNDVKSKNRCLSANIREKIYNKNVKTNVETGGLGEEMATKFLISKKYQVIERNFRTNFGELDIIAKDPNGILVFIEVKALHGQNYNELKPEDNLTVAKYLKLRKTCEYYANLKNNLVDKILGWRIDLIALTMNNNGCLLRHYKNIAR